MFAILLAGCGDSGRSTPLTEDDLPLLVLTPDDLPDGFRSGEGKYILAGGDGDGCVAMYRVELESASQTAASSVVLWEDASLASQAVFSTERGPFPLEISTSERFDRLSGLGDVARAWDLRMTAKDGREFMGYGIQFAYGTVDVRLEFMGVDGEGVSYEQTLDLAEIHLKRIKAQSVAGL
jgi:hypothetical protein